MDKEINSNRKRTEILLGIEAVQDSLEDIKTLLQLFEVSQRETEEDIQTVRTIHIILKMLDALVQNDMKLLSDMVRQTVSD